MENKIKIKFFDKVIESTNPTLIRETISNSKCTKCWDCSNGFPSKCSKVADVKKESIESYDYIKRGFQVVSEDGDMPVFTVLECSNFHKEEPKPLMPSSEMRELMNSIKTTVFDSDNISAINATIRKNFAKYRK